MKKRFLLFPQLIYLCIFVFTLLTFSGCDDEGINRDYTDGFNSGYDEGYNDGYAEGESYGYDRGYEDGRDDAY